MWLDFLFFWPDQLPALHTVDPLSSEAIAIHLSLQQHHKAESALAARAAKAGSFTPFESSFLRCYVSLVRNDLELSSQLIDKFSEQFSQSHSHFTAFLQAQLCLKRSNPLALPELNHPFWHEDRQWLPLLISQAATALMRSDLVSCDRLLAKVPTPYCLQAVRIRASCFLRQRQFQPAIELLAPAVQRCPQNLELQVDYINALMEARSQSYTVPALRQAVKLHGEHPRLLASVCAVKLLQRQPSLARRAALVQRLWPDAVQKDLARISNALVAYEQIGHSDWLAHLAPSVLRDVHGQLSIQENRCLQLASVQSPLISEQLKMVVHAYASNPVAPPWQLPSRGALSSGSPLRIAWVTGDVCHHPVARFIMGFFEASAHHFYHQHHLVNLFDHQNESYVDRFRRYPQLQYLDASASDPSEKARLIRESEFDVAIDLSGWTGGHFMRGFLARLAPVQLNYLGYFASTGLPTMDAWIGDDYLFPRPMQEWHSENIHRLPRCFIAWQPSQQLEEAHEPVTSAPTGGIRFGCFNHNRKLSDATLRLWGKLLGSLPSASLVLKANAATDPSTQTLLVRRMRRAGLDPERVIWLPLAPSHRQHLQQYTHIDVALDCFPNGGCTTTCEALWMGVPVITLTGSHYVSRMSTAVLQGAGLAEWCAATEEEYLYLARQQADRLVELRGNREHWRDQVVHNPLGDAAGLMKVLEQSFSTLHTAALS